MSGSVSPSQRLYRAGDNYQARCYLHRQMRQPLVPIRYLRAYGGSPTVTRHSVKWLSYFLPSKIVSGLNIAEEMPSSSSSSLRKAGKYFSTHTRARQKHKTKTKKNILSDKQDDNERSNQSSLRLGLATMHQLDVEKLTILPNHPPPHQAHPFQKEFKFNVLLYSNKDVAATSNYFQGTASGLLASFISYRLQSADAVANNQSFSRPVFALKRGRRVTQNTSAGGVEGGGGEGGGGVGGGGPLSSSMAPVQQQQQRLGREERGGKEKGVQVKKKKYDMI